MFFQGGFSQTTTAQDTSVEIILARAYSLLRVNSPEARGYFERAVDLDPKNVLVRKQLAYLYFSQQQYEASRRQFIAADSLQPSDSTKLEIVYVDLRLHQNTEARTLSSSLVNSPYSDVRQQAQDELSLLDAATAVWWTRIYAVPFYDTRWETTFFQGFIQEGYYLTEDKILSGYGFAMYSGDARSNGGLSPSIFSDNAIILGLGLKAAPLTGLQVSVQQGIAFDVIQRGNSAQTRGDFRAVATYGNGIYPNYTFHSDVKFPFSPSADLYSSFGYYSRYQDGIGYLQLKGGLRVLEVSRTVGDLYVLLGLAKDTEKEYYNNIAEGGIGFRLTPNVNWGLYADIEYRRGAYIDIATKSPLPYDRYYDSFRFYLIFDRMF